MSRQLLRWCCVWAALSALGCGPSIFAATNFVGYKRFGVGPSTTYYWLPTNLVINVGDTVRWTNLGGVHSVNPAVGSPEPFCGTGTNEIQSCTATFNIAGLFPYDCYQHLPTMTGTVRVLAPPVVTITNPPNNSLFPTHANVLIAAQAADADGAVTNVQFLNNGVSFATSTVAPYTATLSNVAPGYYNLRARAVDNSALVTTSAVVTVRMAGPPTLALTNNPDGPLRFRFNTVTGVSYVVEGAPALTNFSSLVTNPGTGTAQEFSQTNPAPSQNFFRLRLQ
jgi:plastocyanin